MLNLSQDQNLTAVSWETLDLKPRLPEQLRDFFEQIGTMPARSGCRRAYQRFYLRGKAIAQRDCEVFGVFTADASRQGLRFLSPIELQPKERIRIRLPNTKIFQIEIVRCQRMDDLCFECGAMFVLGS